MFRNNVAVSDFVSLVCVLVVIVGLKLCATSAGIKRYKSII